jgi:hypothetical protein
LQLERGASFGVLFKNAEAIDANKWKTRAIASLAVAEDNLPNQVN